MKRTLFATLLILIWTSTTYCSSAENGAGALHISSSAFGEGGRIPLKYTCDGQDINPPLKFENVPGGAKSLALVMDDPDAPNGIWVHWVVWNIGPATREIRENSVPKGALQGTNDFRKRGYGGPCPPATHTYSFKLYALDAELKLGAGAAKSDLERAMKGHILSQAVMHGVYGKR